MKHLPSSRPFHVVLQWPRLGPYHLARVRALGRALEERGDRLTVVEAASTDALYGSLFDTPSERTARPDAGSRAEAHAAPFARVTLFPGAVFETLTPKQIRAAMHRALDRLAPDVVGVNSYSLPDALAALEWARRHRRVAIGMTDSKADDGPRTGWRERLKARLVGQFDALLLAGSPQTRYFRSLGFSGPVDTGYDVVDNDHFAAGSGAHAGTDRPDPHFLVVARLVGVKNLPRLLDAYARYRSGVSATGPAWRLRIVGDGPGRTEIRARVAELGLGESVHLDGAATVEALPEVYRQAAALVHPAAKDTWGLVVNEAMAAGLPVLVSRAAGCAEDLVVEGVTGWTFDPLDPEAMADALARMAALPERERRAMGEAARRHIADWSPERFAAAFVRLADAGAPRARRGLDPVVAAMLWAMRTLSSSHTAFHAVRD